MKIFRGVAHLFNSEQGRSHGSVRSGSASRSRSHRRTGQDGSSSSNDPPNSDNSTWTQQSFRAPRIDEHKLRDLLTRKFGSNYSVRLQSDVYTVRAETRLSEDELLSCVYRRRH
ncbi:hypothetical protein F5Y14DRAFT_415684 [Nemania sp. NC0429]|nr:hypothetical protein F5Y14DRAFT_415684 [Nemania sp. NC0429]